ncbi:MAG: sulfatase-like hydrolase/transferase [Planctomycetaceae bacterium]
MKRHPLRLFLYVTLIPLLLAGVSRAQSRPNIVFIMADDLGWRDVGFEGAAFFETPNIDRLSREGMRFTAAYSGGPNCSPTRACLMTGMYTPRHHIYTPGGLSKGDPRYMRLLVPARDREDAKLIELAAAQFHITNTLDPSFTCIPEVLKMAGYTSARFGKWHLENDTQGFDVSSADGIGGPHGKHYGEPKVTEQLTERAMQFLEENQAGPFFLYVPYWDVHTPLRGREDLVEKYRSKLQSLPESERGRFNPVYAAMIEAVDTGVGRIVEKVDELGIAENTLIVFISDNGGTISSQLAPLRGMKGSLYEAGIRVPACMRWTGRIEPGSLCETPITSVDFLPTFAAMAGAELPTRQPVDGTDLSPLLSGQEIEDRSIFWHYPLYLEGKGLTFDTPDGGTYSWRGFPSTAMRRGDWKLIEFHEDNTIALYNLADDPAETTNVAEVYPDIAEQLRSELDTWQDDTQAPIPSTPNPECILEPLTGVVSERDVAPSAAMGIMVGEVTDNSANAQVRVTRVDHPYHREVLGTAGVVEFMLSRKGGSNAEPQTIIVEATAEHDFIARATFTGLEPGLEYHCKTRIGRTKEALLPGPEATFRTLPGESRSSDVRFVVVTGMNYAKFHGDNRIDLREHVIKNNTALPSAYVGADRYLGYPALESILKLKPNFFVGTGDNVYYDTPDEPRAESLTELRQKWHEQFVQPRYLELFASVPMYWEIDDHDYRIDDCDNTGEFDPTPAVGLRVMLEQLPYGSADFASVRTYRTHRVSKDLQIWLTENRLYRSPNSMPDGSEKSIWGQEQKAWLKQTLLSSDAPYKLLISPTPLIGPDDLRKTDNHCDVGGFQHERDEFFNWLVEHNLVGNGFAIICGDRHWQYRSIHPLGIEEYSCGALVDANSRPPGNRVTPRGTDPDNLIQQPYAQDPPSGGFLMASISTEQRTLTICWHDEHGERLHVYTLPVPSADR